MSETGTSYECPSQVLVTGSRQEVLASWLESERQALLVLGGRIETAERAGRERELERLKEERAKRIAEFDRCAEEMKRERDDGRGRHPSGQPMDGESHE